MQLLWLFGDYGSRQAAADYVYCSWHDQDLGALKALSFTTVVRAGAGAVTATVLYCRSEPSNRLGDGATLGLYLLDHYSHNTPFAA